MASGNFFEAKKLNDKSFKDLDDELSAYMAQADNALEALQKGADALVADLKALPKPRSKIAKPGYVHLLDSFATKTSEDGTSVVVGWGKYYGPILEHGSKKMDAQPHFYPTWKANKEKYYRVMVDALRKE